MGLLRSAALALDKSITRVADTFELTRGRIPSGTCIASLWPRLAGDLISQLENEPVIITGTNGKCTTSRFLAEILQQAGHETLHTQEVAASGLFTNSRFVHLKPPGSRRAACSF